MNNINLPSQVLGYSLKHINHSNPTAFFALWGFFDKHFILYPCNEPASIKVPIFLRQFLQDFESSVQSLEGPPCCYEVLVAIGILVVIATAVKVTPEYVDCYSPLQVDYIVKP